MTTRHAALYLRVSTKSQDTRSQEPDLARWAELQALQVHWYRDHWTGTTMERPGWESLWADVLAGKVATIVVWRLDRLGRSAADLTRLFAELRARKVDLVSIRDGITSLDSIAGRLLATIIAALAEYELEVRSERQRAGIAAAKAAGQAFGRPKGTGRPIKRSPEVDATVLRYWEMRVEVSRIAKVCKLSRNTVYSIIRAEKARRADAGAGSADGRSARRHTSRTGKPPGPRRPSPASES